MQRSLKHVTLRSVHDRSETVYSQSLQVHLCDITDMYQCDRCQLDITDIYQCDRCQCDVTDRYQCDRCQYDITDRYQ